MTVNVQAAIYKSGKWFVIERSHSEELNPGELSLPGGQVDIGKVEQNILEETIKREIWEELGISIDNIHYVCSASFMAGKDDYVVNVVFFATYSGNQALSINPDEVAGLHRLSLDEVEEHETIPEWEKEYVRRAHKVLLTLPDLI